MERSIPVDMVDGPVSPPIENVLLVGSYHGRRIASGRRCTCSSSPSIVVERSIPVDMVDGPVGTAIEDVLLSFVRAVGIGCHHGDGIASGRRGLRNGGPSVAVERSVPGDMIDCPVGTAIEDMLLSFVRAEGIGCHHGNGVASGRRSPRSSGPRVAVERSIPVDMVDRAVGPPIKNMLVHLIGMLLIRSYHGYWVASGDRGPRSQCPLVEWIFLAQDHRARP